MQPSSTASTGRSIWDLVGRKTFEHNVNALKNVSVVPESRAVYTIADRQLGDTNKACISIEVERELADDFAFIAAYEEGVRTVTAAAVEATSSGITVVLAANEGINDSVESAFRHMFRPLEACARCELSRKACADELLEIVIKLNRNRIYGRLGSRKYVPPSHRKGQSQATLPAQIEASVDTRAVSKSSADWTRFRTEVMQFRRNFNEMEGHSSSEDYNSVVAVLKHTYEMTIDGISLPQRLRKLGFHQNLIDCKQHRQLMKLSNYVRICQALAEKARSLRSMFEHLQIQKLEPFVPVMWNGTRQFVHAEVQIIVHYMILNCGLKPRIIGASKEACFLCDSFVRAHGRFQLSRAHRQLYHLWSVPDLQQYNDSSLNKLRKCLQDVNRDLVEAKPNISQWGRRRPFPIQSSINLIKAMVRNASMSTMVSTQNVTAEAAAIASLTLSQPGRRSDDCLSNASLETGTISALHDSNTEQSIGTLTPPARLLSDDLATNRDQDETTVIRKHETSNPDYTRYEIAVLQESVPKDQVLLPQYQSTSPIRADRGSGIPARTEKYNTPQPLPRIKKQKKKNTYAHSKRKSAPNRTPARSTRTPKSRHTRHRRQKRHKTRQKDASSVRDRQRQKPRASRRRKSIVWKKWKYVLTSCKLALCWILGYHLEAAR